MYLIIYSNVKIQKLTTYSSKNRTHKKTKKNKTNKATSPLPARISHHQDTHRIQHIHHIYHMHHMHYTHHTTSHPNIHNNKVKKKKKKKKKKGTNNPLRSYLSPSQNLAPPRYTLWSSARPSKNDFMDRKYSCNRTEFLVSFVG